MQYFKSVFGVEKFKAPFFIGCCHGFLLANEYSLLLCPILRFGKQFVERIRGKLDQTATDLLLECQVVDVDRTMKSLTLISPRTGKTEIAAHAVVFACGAREKTRSERGWIAGHRPARQFYTMQLLQLLDDCHVLPMKRPAIIGSDLIAYSKMRRPQINRPFHVF